jgi:maleylpyruvate isomerase
MRPHQTLAVCLLSHRRLLEAVTPLSDEDLRSPSGLPRWSRAHVLAHLVNKANAHVWLFGGPPAGEIRQLYPPGHDQDVAAEAGADRTASELRSELKDAFDRLEAVWSGFDENLWERHGVMTAGPRTMTEIVSHHLRNVEVHHVDLRIGYSPHDWPAAFVEDELAKRLRGLPDRAEHADLLAWLLGRASAPDLGPW